MEGTMQQQRTKPANDEAVVGGPMTVISPNQPNTRMQQLRRAVYVHISDLVSTYQIQPSLLEEEINRVNAQNVNPVSDDKSTRFFGGVPTELDTSFKKRLQPPRGGNNMVVLVGKVRIVVDKHRVDGSRVRLAEVEVGDETGIASLRARDEQINILEEIANQSGAVVLRNCTLELYQGKHIRLAVTKWGKITAYPDHVPSTPEPPKFINRDRKYSMINLSLIANDTTTTPSQDQMSSPQNDGDNYSQQTANTPSNQHYQQHHTRRDRRPSRISQNTPSNVHHPSYIHQSNNMRQYQGPPHGYAPGPFVSDTSRMPQYYSPQRQELNPQQQQQLMFQQHQQHQYEIQQRQQMHLYQRNQQLEGMQQSPMQFGMPPTSIAAESSNYESNTPVRYNMQSIQMPIPLHPHGASPLHGTIPPPPPPPPPRNQQDYNRSQSPGNRMNAYAAMFDPNNSTNH